jgi:hypothetical protein
MDGHSGGIHKHGDLDSGSYSCRLNKPDKDGLQSHREGTRMTPVEEATYALDNKVDRERLSKEARAEYDRLLQERHFAATRGEAEASLPPRVRARSSPETRARILRMFKEANSKYAKPFENDRLAVLSVMGGNWEEYGQVVLQMAILDTLLSIEEKLSPGAVTENKERDQAAGPE